MDEMLKKLMEKKKPMKMDSGYKKAKMGVLKDLHGEMGKMMGDDVKGLKKVTVAAPSEEGLMKGLDKAEELLEGKAESEESEEMESEEGMEDMPESMEEIEAKIAELEALKAKLKMKE